MKIFNPESKPFRSPNRTALIARKLGELSCHDQKSDADIDRIYQHITLLNQLALAGIREHITH